MFIITSIEKNIGSIILDNPAKKNALSNDLLMEIIEALKEFRNKKARVVILRAKKGVKVWSSGHDIDEIPTDGNDPLRQDSPLERAMLAIQMYPGPVIAMVEGSVWGGACDMSITCDMIIGTPDSSFAITPAKLGVPYNASGILHFINRLGLSHAKEMFFTAAPIDAETAMHFGILNHVIDNEKIEEFSFNLAERITKNSPLSIAVIKEQFQILTNAHPLTPFAFEHIDSLRRKVLGSDDFREGIEAFKNKRKPDFKGR
ncbi:MAG: methylmalonyl-CoA decarboxylase [Ignavibacteria bacterium]|nr:methylmalonyl-CoA decarboxylase [Ignavibacteria bacterium]